MRALIVSDKVEPKLHDSGIRERVGEIDLILGCGDLPFYYLEFLVSMLDKPCYFVFGNHGREVEYQGDGRAVYSPAGATNLHGHAVREGSLLLAGLEGSIRYNNSSRFQYTETEMWNNIARLAPSLLKNRVRHGRWLDVLIAHSPPYGIHDQPDPTHTGFRSFLRFMQVFKPRYLLHGHIHIYRHDTVASTRYAMTEVINVYPYRIMDLEPQVTSNE